MHRMSMQLTRPTIPPQRIWREWLRAAMAQKQVVFNQIARFTPSEIAVVTYLA